MIRLKKCLKTIGLWRIFLLSLGGLIVLLIGACCAFFAAVDYIEREYEGGNGYHQ